LPEAASLRRASGDAGQGVLLAVVGPSGVGKDSLIAHARTVFAFDPSVLFVRRAVTRPAMAAAEDHDCLSPDEFAAALAAGRFAVSWQAHGLSYGIPAAVRAHLATGGVAVVNGSRAALADIASVFGNVVTVHVTARPDILAARLAGRERETEADMARRLERAAIALPECGRLVEIDNGGAFDAAAEAFVAVIRKAVDRAS